MMVYMWHVSKEHRSKYDGRHVATHRPPVPAGVHLQQFVVMARTVYEVDTAMIPIKINSGLADPTDYNDGSHSHTSSSTNVRRFV